MSRCNQDLQSRPCDINEAAIGSLFWDWATTTSSLEVQVAQLKPRFCQSAIESAQNDHANVVQSMLANKDQRVGWGSQYAVSSVAAAYAGSSGCLKAFRCNFARHGILSKILDPNRQNADILDVFPGRVRAPWIKIF